MPGTAVKPSEVIQLTIVPSTHRQRGDGRRDAERGPLQPMRAPINIRWEHQSINRSARLSLRAGCIKLGVRPVGHNQQCSARTHTIFTRIPVRLWAFLALPVYLWMPSQRGPLLDFLWLVRFGVCVSRVDWKVKTM